MNRLGEAVLTRISSRNKKSGVKKLITEIITENTNWVTPDDVIDNSYTVRIFGGGGASSGNIGFGDYGTLHYNEGLSVGGGGGYMNNKTLTIKSREVISITIGKGGIFNSNESIGNSGGTTSFGSYLSAAGGSGGSANSAGNGGSGGGGVWQTDASSNNNTSIKGGNGNQFGGGGFNGIGGSWGGNGGTNKISKNGTNTLSILSIDSDLTGEGLGGGNFGVDIGEIGGGDGGYGGSGGGVIWIGDCNNTMTDAEKSNFKNNIGYGGGGGYGANGGNGASFGVKWIGTSSTSTTTTIELAKAGGGGGGYGKQGKGGNGFLFKGSSVLPHGGGGGAYGPGGDDKTKPLYGGGGCVNKNGADGVCIIQYYKYE